MFLAFGQINMLSSTVRSPACGLFCARRGQSACYVFIFPPALLPPPPSLSPGANNLIGFHPCSLLMSGFPLTSKLAYIIIMGPR